MKKRWFKIFLVVIILMLTNLLTYKATTNMAFGMGKNDKDRFVKIQFLEKFVKDNYLYEVDDNDLAVGELKGVVQGLKDPYSEYLTADEMKKMEEFTTGKFFGIGVYISPGKDGFITVVTPIEGSPADKAGIKAGDRILKIDDVEYTSEQLLDATKAIKGKKGTKVELLILPEDGNKTKEVEVERAEVKIETIISEKIGDLGYIGITLFDDSTARDFKKALKELEAQKVKGLILDLRGNGGGVVEGATGVCDALLPAGRIVYGKNKAGEEVFEYRSKEKHSKLPLVVLINEGSASASEIVAGAIQDYQRGTLVGETSFGKGIVQTVNKFAGGDGIKLTTSQYFTPKGNNIHKVGIQPDVTVKEPEDIEGIGVDFIDQDTQLQKAIEILNKK